MSTPRDDARGTPPTPHAHDTPAAPALELRGLVKQYGGVQALR
ncbi:sugar ABC transporter ATP-binding protein, partial [Paraburkholderia sp. Ac-20347]|nr:sugar ABC transporter ATP-binding protein [Paraburkholderia sp. Ac-20347]